MFEAVSFSLLPEKVAAGGAVLVRGLRSSRWPVTSGAPGGSVLGTITIFFTDILMRGGSAPSVIWR